jgi:hypothetical protein
MTIRFKRFESSKSANGTRLKSASAYRLLPGLQHGLEHSNYHCELERLAMCGHFRRNGRVWSCSLTYTNSKNALAGRNRQARRPGARE